MTDATTLTEYPVAEQNVPSRRGRWCFIAGLVGIAQGAALLVWPHQVGDRRFSFPLTASGYVIAQATFFLQHLPLVAAVLAIANLSAVRRNVTARRALAAATMGLALLAVLELVAMSAATTEEDSNLGTTIDSLYSIPVLLAGAGLLVGGIVLLRQHTLGRRLPRCLLALGAPLMPGCE